MEDIKQEEKLLYSQKEFPVFQNRMYESADEARNCPCGDIYLVENQVTGLIYNAAFEPELVVYDEYYQNEQAVSKVFQSHLEGVSNIIDRAIGRENLVEVGCGKGFFLEMLREKGFNLTGFDPTYEGHNINVKKKIFEEGVDIEADGIILRHVLEHIQDPFSFLTQLKKANQDSGKIYIEVPCFDWICERRNWFDIFYEHVNYFRLLNFHQMFDNIIESGRIFGGQYLYIVAELSSLKEPKMVDAQAIEFPEDFLNTLTKENTNKHDKSVIWGGASKGVIFGLLKERAGLPVTTVIDINPAKQGRFLAATGLLVQSPEQVLPSLKKGSKIFILNSNYLDEIRAISENNFQYIEVDHV